MMLMENDERLIVLTYGFLYLSLSLSTKAYRANMNQILKGVTIFQIFHKGMMMNIDKTYENSSNDRLS